MLLFLQSLCSKCLLELDSSFISQRRGPSVTFGQARATEMAEGVVFCREQPGSRLFSAELCHYPPQGSIPNQIGGGSFGRAAKCLGQEVVACCLRNEADGVSPDGLFTTETTAERRQRKRVGRTKAFFAAALGCEEVSCMAAVTDKAFNSWLLMPASSFYTRPGHLLRARRAGTPERRLFNRPLPVWPRTLEWELWEPTWEKPRGQGKGHPSPHLRERSCGPQTVYRGCLLRREVSDRDEDGPDEEE
ncbi:unnamed protein product [Arctogadus glacialis]